MRSNNLEAATADFQMSALSASTVVQGSLYGFASSLVLSATSALDSNTNLIILRLCLSNQRLSIENDFSHLD
ncbi:hypothetical protein SLA2020_128890 [Shorea laevis]